MVRYRTTGYSNKFNTDIQHTIELENRKKIVYYNRAINDERIYQPKHGYNNVL